MAKIYEGEVVTVAQFEEIILYQVAMKIKEELNGVEVKDLTEMELLKMKYEMALKLLIELKN